MCIELCGDLCGLLFFVFYTMFAQSVVVIISFQFVESFLIELVETKRKIKIHIH